MVAVDRLHRSCNEPGGEHRPADPIADGPGLARSGPLGIGLDTAADGALRDRSSQSELPVWTLGSLRRGLVWESAAIPEIRDQAAALARRLLGPVPTRDRRPLDPYDLPLSTTPAAADAWCRALHAICALQGGAAEALSEAVVADPGFAIGHAALALVGQEWGAPVDVEDSVPERCGRRGAAPRRRPGAQLSADRGQPADRGYAGR